MKKKSKLSLETKYVVLILSIIFIILIFVSVKYSATMSPIKTAVGTVITPMQKGINSIGRYVSDSLEQLQNINNLIEENKELKEKLSTIEYENKILQQDKYELDTLRGLYELDQKYADYPKVAATVISKDAGNWYNVFTIDKGSNDGLSVDMNVIAGNGLVGIITEVGHNYSKVRSIIDDSSEVTGMFLKSSETCFIKGNLELIDDGRINVEMINKDVKVNDGDEVVTSYISSKFLPGILIGYINDISMDSSNMTKSGYLAPAVDFKSLDIVLVITELKEALY